MWWKGPDDPNACVLRVDPCTSGIANTILPWAALNEEDGKRTLTHRHFIETQLIRPISICFSEVSQRSPAVEAVASTLKSIIRYLIKERRWLGISINERDARPLS
jgi:hypothetical protein